MHWKLQPRTPSLQLLAGGRIRPSGWHGCSPAVGCRCFPGWPRVPRLGDGMTDESPSMLASGYFWLGGAASIAAWTLLWWALT